MKPPKKNPAAVALGKLAKGKPKTMTPAAKKARKANAQKAAAKRRLAMALHAKDLSEAEVKNILDLVDRERHRLEKQTGLDDDLDPVPPGPAVKWDDDED